MKIPNSVVTKSIYLTALFLLPIIVSLLSLESATTHVWVYLWVLCLCFLKARSVALSLTLCECKLHFLNLWVAERLE